MEHMQHATYADALERLPAVFSGTVERAWIDVNGHMTILRYLELAVHGVDIVCREIGLDDTYRSSAKKSYFTVEQHAQYLSELHLDQQYSVHVETHERVRKAVHLTAYILDRDRQWVASIIDVTILHVGAETRRSEPFPPEIARAWDELATRTRRQAMLLAGARRPYEPDNNDHPAVEDGG